MGRRLRQRSTSPLPPFLQGILLRLFHRLAAKLPLPGRDPGGVCIFITVLIGIAGGFLGGFIGQSLGRYHEGNPGGSSWPSSERAIVILWPTVWY